MKWLRLRWLQMKLALVKALGGTYGVAVPDHRLTSRALTFQDMDALSRLYETCAPLAVYLNKRIARFEDLEEGLSPDEKDDRQRIVYDVRKAAYREILDIPNEALRLLAKADSQPQSFEVGNLGKTEAL